MWAAVLLAMLAAVCFAAAATLQHDAMGRAAAGRLAVLRSPRWWIGMSATVLGGVLHVSALSLAPVAVVQPVGVLGVPAGVVIGAVRRRRRPAPVVLAAVVVTVVGAGVFVRLVGALPSGAGLSRGTALAAFTSLTLGVAAALAAAGGRGPVWVQSLCRAGAGAALFGLTTALVRMVLLGWQQHPAAWTLLVLAGVTGCNLAGTGLIQAAYRTGSPEVVLGVSAVVDPAVAVAFGFAVLGEGTGCSSSTVAAMLLAAGCAASAVVTLARQRQRHSGPSQPRSTRSARRGVSPGPVGPANSTGGVALGEA
jgi:hypothetical protein